MINDKNKLTVIPTEGHAFTNLFCWKAGKGSLIHLLNAIFRGNSVIKNVKILSTALKNQDIRSVMSKYQTQIESKHNKASRLDIVLLSMR